MIYQSSKFRHKKKKEADCFTNMPLKAYFQHTIFKKNCKYKYFIF